jgi:hypothetical protein
VAAAIASAHKEIAMNLKAIVTSLVLATSTFATVAAEPAAAETSQTSWTALTSPMPLSRGRDVIRFKTSPGGFDQMSFRNVMGSSHIERVIVWFVDGTTYTVDLYAKLDAAQPSIEFSLDGTRRPIDKIIVIGASSRKSSVQLFAR